MTTDSDSIEMDSVLLNFETLVRKPRNFIAINGDHYLLVDYEHLSFAQMAQIERRRRIVQQALQAGDDDGSGANALREVVELLVPDAARTQVMWTPPPTEDDADPQPRPVKVTDTLGARERMSILNLFIDPSVNDAITRIAAGLLRGKATTTPTASSTSDTSSPDSQPRTDRRPQPVGIG